MNRIATFGAALAVVAAGLVGQAQAASVLVTNADFTGYRATPTGSGLVLNGIWGVNGIRISWDISFDGGTQLYTYKYTLSDNSGSNVSITQGDVSHFLLEVSPNFTTDNVKSGSSAVGAPTTFSSTGSSGSEPLMPAAGLFGIKFNFGGGNPSYTLVTDRAPIWGDFYAKDGMAGGLGANTAWNTGFGTDPLAGATDFTNWIPTPDTVTAVPVPAAAWAGMVTMGLMGAVSAMRRRRTQQA